MNLIVSSDEGSALLGVAAWIENIAIGSIGTAVAVLAVAALGFYMATGRQSWRRGLEIVGGVFLIFGASAVAGGLLGMANVSVDTAHPLHHVAPINITPPVAAAYDPYAGASVPQRRETSEISMPDQ